MILSYKNIKLSLIYLLTFAISYFLFYYVALHFFSEYHYQLVLLYHLLYMPYFHTVVYFMHHLSI
ncbi:hypothetical protein EAKF1_ch1173 [Escherichia albertii KF1]|nr:hypothetical protein EAKF1_ch1173 [Escherichia albertii KF1]